MENQNQSHEGKTKNITLKSVLAWIFGIIFLLVGVSLLFTDPVSGIVFLLCAGLTLPAATKLLKDKTGVALSVGLRFVIVIILFGIAIGVSSSKKDNSVAVVPVNQAPVVSASQDQSAPTTSQQSAPAPKKAAVVKSTAPAQTTVVSTAQPAPTPTPTPKPQAPAVPSFSGDGNYIVGTDIQPGTYRTRVGSSGCYYARLKGFGGSSSDISANANTDAPAVITISASDAGFQTSNCATWTENLSQITTSQTSFSDGIFIVGTDILPGTYRSTGGDGCYYARLKSFGGTSSDIAANENTDTSAIITIASTDAGFQSSGCGTWSKIQ
jgi:hypothetical protein